MEYRKGTRKHEPLVGAEPIARQPGEESRPDHQEQPTRPQGAHRPDEVSTHG